MTTFLMVQGIEPVELSDDESFNKARDRANKALRLKTDLEEGNIDGETKGQKYDPMHKLSFKTADGGRISINPDKFIAVGSDEPKDVGGSSDGDEED
jgi:hypothetical protein